jgi:hypothetical protein
VGTGGRNRKGEGRKTETKKESHLSEFLSKLLYQREHQAGFPCREKEEERRKKEGMDEKGKKEEGTN